MSHQTLKRSKLIQESFFHFIILCVIFSISSCEDNSLEELIDPNENIENEIDIQHDAELFRGNISGKILDENLDALAGAIVNIGEEEMMSDENGFFSARDIQLDALGTVIIVSKENYWSNTKLMSTSDLQQNQISIMLLLEPVVKRIESGIGGEVSFEDNVKIDFPENAFVTADGNRYDGTIEISAVYINPRDDNFGMMSPGDFRAFNADSELRTLRSLGMAGVELRGANNELLQLDADALADLYIKVPEGTSIDEVPLWHLDEESGYWLEEGSAQRIGDFYVGAVSHFSWWNCDIPFSAVELSGTVVTENGDGIAGLPVEIILAEEMWNLGTEYTGDAGIFKGWAPKDQNLTMRIRNECGEVFYEEPIGPFSEDTNLDAITVFGQNIIEVCGQMLNCDADPVSNGYVFVQTEESTAYIPIDDEGNFCSSINICDAFSFNIFGIDLDSDLQGVLTSYTVDDKATSNLTLTTCDQVGSFYRFQIDNEPEVIVSDFSINLSDKGLLGFGSGTQVNGEYQIVLLEGQNWGTVDFALGYYDLRLFSATSEVNCQPPSCNAPNIDLVEFSGVGNPIILKLEGTTPEGQNYLVNVSGILEK